MTEEKLRLYLRGAGCDKQWFTDNAENFLVEAGAGAGKTTIMVERIVNQLVSEYCEPEEIVAITFTNKSTLELRTRLDELLAERLKPLKEKARKQETLTPEEHKLMERLEYLIRESGRMQVSTIHSFCQTMLESMPFASPLGLDMQVLEDADSHALEFLRSRMAEDYKLFREVRNMGMWPWWIEKFFLDRCNNNEATTVYCTDQTKIDRWLQKDIPPLAIAFHQKLLDVATKYSKDINGNFRIHYLIKQVTDMTSAAFAADQRTMLKLTWLCLQDGEHCPLQSGLTYEQKKAFRGTPLGTALEELWLGKEADALRKAAAPLVHSYVMKDLVPLLAQYRQKKEAEHLATFNDLLLRTRDMLKTREDARAYFHQRYKVIYVDEMQDTDPVQTEMLFYLTTAEEHFEGEDWQNCRPVPGSLFLVGDPKQAIYRFRGADIGVYNILLKLFQSEDDFADNGKDANAVGRKVTLRFNYRSSKEICDLSDKVFQPKTPAQDYHFTGGTYHAQYVAMDAKAGSCPRSAMGWYYPDDNRSGGDPGRVAAFIRTMIDQKVEIGIHDPAHNKWKHEAQPRDFLVLTSGKITPQNYAAALQEVGIPADVSGEKGFKATNSFYKTMFERMALHLKALLSPRDDRLVIRLLRECYLLGYTEYGTDQDGKSVQIAECKEEQLIHELLLRTAKETPGGRKAAENVSLSGLLYPKKLASIRLALEDEDADGNRYLLDLCDALSEIAVLRQLVREKPAMAVIEHLLEGGYGIWSPSELDPRERKQRYSEVQQYLNLVRKHKERSFPALAAYAIECVDKTFEHDLALEPADNVVRIMNLHKAKGLEGEVVILAYSSYSDRTPHIHVERKGDETLEYVALHPKKGNYETKYAVGWPEDWLSVQMAEEKKYADAEYARLLYVAATRAKTMLVVYGEPQVQQVPTAAPATAVQPAAAATAQSAAASTAKPKKEEKLSYWQPLVQNLPNFKTLGTQFQDAYDALMDGVPRSGPNGTVDIIQTKRAPRQADKEETNFRKCSPSIQPEDEDAGRREVAENLADSDYYPITPSGLDHAARTGKKNRDEEDPEASVPDGTVAAPQSEADEENTVFVPKDHGSEISAEEAAANPGPYGAAWGNMIHKVMELAVRNSGYTTELLAEYARYAVKDALEQDLVDKRQRGFLGLEEEDDDAAILKKLVPQVEETVSFLANADCDLRRLTDGGVCYPEMPFFLQAQADDEKTGELYCHLMAHMKKEEADGRTLVVEGIIDLAVFKDDCWYVVDYKTDKVRKTETDDSFAQRLKEEYTPQITAYARVLEQMTGKKAPVKRAWLCSIPLRGRFIELDINN